MCRGGGLKLGGASGESSSFRKPNGKKADNEEKRDTNLRVKVSLMSLTNTSFSPRAKSLTPDSLLTSDPPLTRLLPACRDPGRSMKRASSLGVLNVVDKAAVDRYQVSRTSLLTF